MQPHVCRLRDEAIGQHAGQTPRHKRLFALFAPTTDDIVTFLHLLQKAWNISRVVLPVSVYGDHNRTLGYVKAGGKGGRLAEIAS